MLIVDCYYGDVTVMGANGMDFNYLCKKPCTWYTREDIMCIIYDNGYDVQRLRTKELNYAF